MRERNEANKKRKEEKQLKNEVFQVGPQKHNSGVFIMLWSLRGRGAEEKNRPEEKEINTVKRLKNASSLVIMVMIEMHNIYP